MQKFVEKDLIERIPEPKRSKIIALLEARRSGETTNALSLNRAAKPFNLRYCIVLKMLLPTNLFYVGSDGRYSWSIPGHALRSQQIQSGEWIVNARGELTYTPEQGEGSVGPEQLVTDVEIEDINKLNTKPVEEHTIAPKPYFRKKRKKTIFSKIKKAYHKLKFAIAKYRFARGITPDNLSEGYMRLRGTRGIKRAAIQSRLRELDPLGVYAYNVRAGGHNTTIGRISKVIASIYGPDALTDYDISNATGIRIEFITDDCELTMHQMFKLVGHVKYQYD